MLYGEDDMKLKQSKGSVGLSMIVFIMLVNLSIGIVNSSSLFTAFLDPDAYPGLTEEICIAPIGQGAGGNPGFGGEWKNINGAGYKCYFKNTNREMSDEMMEAQVQFADDDAQRNLIDTSREAGSFSFIQGLLGQFGNSVAVIGDLISLFWNSIAFPGKYMLTLWTCPDTNYYKEGVGIGQVALNSESGIEYNAVLDADNNGTLEIDEAPCTGSTGVDGYEQIIGYIQVAMYVLYFIFFIQFIANRGFRGMT